MNSRSISNDPDAKLVPGVRPDPNVKSDLPATFNPDLESNSDVKSNSDDYPNPDDHGERPKIKPFNEQSAFYPGDKVYIKASATSAREGPYLVEKAVGNETYTLSDLTGRTAKDGAEVKGADLEETD